MPRQAEICERLAQIGTGNWEHKSYSEYFGQGYGETTHFVSMGDNMLKIGVQNSSDVFLYYLAEFIANAPKDIRWQSERIKALETELGEVEEKYRSLLKCARCCANCIHFSCGLDAYPCCECLGDRDETKRWYSHWELYVSSEEETGKGDA